MQVRCLAGIRRTLLAPPTPGVRFLIFQVRELRTRSAKPRPALILPLHGTQGTGFLLEGLAPCIQPAPTPGLSGRGTYTRTQEAWVSTSTQAPNSLASLGLLPRHRGASPSSFPGLSRVTSWVDTHYKKLRLSHCPGG